MRSQRKSYLVETTRKKPNTYTFNHKGKLVDARTGELVQVAA